MIELNKPIKRIILPGVKTDYIENSGYSNNLFEQKKVIQILEEDLKKISEYVEPNEKNFSTYSLKLYELFIKASIEFENMCKQILLDNKYDKKITKLDIKDYYKINTLMCLDRYSCSINLIPDKNFIPFENWSKNHVLKWYQDYNKVKHNRTNNFKMANLENVLLSISALRILLYAQYGNFSLDNTLSFDTIKMGAEDSENDNDYLYLNHSLFLIKKPSESDYKYKYNFKWDVIKEETDCIEKFDFNQI
ncbi:MAG: hypothetical protein E7161_00020 [Firmicutes bacterium]|nr:hypothetical protein [Bacillota bacterium]